jgi:hypothetical protein
VVEVAGEKNSTLVMPVPVELLRFFEKMAPPPATAASPDEPVPDDLGDAEVAAAEAAISHAPAPGLESGARETSAPALPQIPEPAIGDNAESEEQPAEH